MSVSYLNKTVVATLKPSAIHGIGVFALTDIPKGHDITDHTSEKPQNSYFELSEHAFSQLKPYIQTLILDRHIFYENDSLKFLSPNTTAILQMFMNHSKEPNTNGYKAIKDIKAGEELTEDFNTLKDSGLHPLTKRHMQFL